MSVAVLVTGATGTVGRHVVDGLVRAGASVHALTRTPERAGLPAGVTVFRGDLEDPDTLRTALSGVDRLYLFPVPETAEAVAGMAREAGVRHIVTLSSISAGYNSGDFSGDHHRAVEKAVEASGLEWTHVRPGEFMANVVNWAPAVQDENVVREPFGEAPSVMVHEADIAEVAVEALTGEGHAGAVYSLTGPQVLTKRDQVRTLAEVLDRDIVFEELTPQQARQRWLDRGVPAEVADWLTQPPAEHAVVGPTATEVTGRPARTFAQWVADHRADFAPA
ncbi:nucleotide-diphosphate-sugar epimerase [Streptomyces nigrescens]|uniref:Nucleotide-diphosphate-sugar epimerase n=2 Tax=Streptomyces TaxID=1883 RepID=A0ABN6R0M9_STRNI|nr:NAD(P)H-binding protein [Streptomyces nigrescens]MEE4424145.1 NAD(P)H-binding protein [Streptomyces sp. DSM 41528]BDM71232.1 nucleotide-diphosphate-sugar epimerase [Streptomyces nigrescens]